MRCDQARVLIGVRDELDAPTRRALQAHVESCRACAEVWLEEAEFMRLMATRSSPPPSPRLEAQLLAVPARDLALARLRAQAARIGPPTLLVLGLALGAFWTVQHFTGPEDGGGANSRTVALAPDAPGTAQGSQPGPASRAPAPQAAAGPAVIARQRTVDLSGAVDLGSAAGQARLAAAAPETAPGSRLGDRPAAGSITGRRGVPGSLPPPFAAGSVFEPSPTALLATAAPGRASAGVPPPADPTAVPRSPDPSTAPPASPTAATWQLDLKVLLDDPGADLTGTEVVVQIETQVDGTWATLYEEPLVFAGSLAEDAPRLNHPPPYEVELFAALPGYALCPGESRTRTVDAGILADRRGEIRFHLCAQPTPVPEATGSATAGPPAPATSTEPPPAPPATATPSPVDAAIAGGG